MSKSKHTEAQMIAALKQVEAGRKVEDVAREVGASVITLNPAIRDRVKSGHKEWQKT